MSYAITGLNMVIGILYTPIMIRLLGQSEYGLYTLVGSVVSYLSLFSLGFTGAYLRFYSRYKSQNDEEAISNLNGMFITIFMVMGLIALLCGMMLSRFTKNIFGDKLGPQELDKAKTLMQILVVNIALTFPSSVFDSFITSKERFVFQRLVTLIGVIFNPLICLPLLLLGYKSVAVVMVTTIITAVRLFINIYFCFSKLNIKVSFKRFDFILMGEMLVFSLFIFLRVITDQINWNVDKYILGRYRGTVEVAIYSVGVQFNTYLISIATIVSSVFTPRINKLVATKPNSKEISDDFTKVGRLQFSLILLIVLGFITFGSCFVKLWAGDEYAVSYYVAIIVMIPSILPLSHSLGLEILKAYNKHKLPVLIVVITSIINLFISIPLTKMYGAVGSVIGTAISVLLEEIFTNFYYIYAVGIDMKHFWVQILKLSKGAVIPILLSIGLILFKVEDIGTSYILFAIPYTIIYIVSMYKFGFNDYEKSLIDIKKFLKNGVK